MKRLLSGVKPTGRPHIGNYFGAMKQFVDMQNDYDSHIFIADMHALTTVQDADDLKQATFDLALDYLAIGIDPEKVTLFKQSDVPQVAELGWIFNCITTVPYLMRAHAYKDAQAKNKEINAGVFTYPLLMSADILIYDADVVPVGQDQKQHVEYARDTAEKFNRTFSDTFKLPEPKILESVKTIPGTDGQKMSKSYNNTIPLFASLDEIKKAVATIPTDSLPVADPKPDYEKDNVFRLHELFTTGEELEKIIDGYKNGGFSYKDSKDILVKNIDAFIAPLREKREELSKNPDYVIDVLQKGGVKAAEIADAKMDDIRKKVGFGK
jgi:tryptophanyl-tRNA synthetase